MLAALPYSLVAPPIRGKCKFVSWDKRFVDRIAVPGRKPLVTLRDAATFITKLPKAEHDADEWQAAMQALLLVVEHDGPTMFARIGVMRALNLTSSACLPRRAKTSIGGRRKLGDQ